MKDVLLMGSEIGRVPIVINDRIVRGIRIFEGKILDSNTIHIQSLSKENCIIELKKAFELQIHFWLRNQITDTNIIYDTTTNKKNSGRLGTE